MKLSASNLASWTALSAIVAGLLFVAIQVFHPADTIESVTTDTWAIIHYVSIAMALFFVVGIAGIFAQYAEKVGWLGLAGFLVLSLGLLLTAALQFVEAVIEPTLVSTNPAYVEGLLALVEGHPVNVDLGAVPTFHALASLCFVGGTLLFGIATLRARIVPRLASVTFAFGLLLMGPVVSAFGAPRLAAVPIGLSLAWMGYAVWSERRASSSVGIRAAAVQPDPTAA
jgi:hypothetical protein